MAQKKTILVLLSGLLILPVLALVSPTSFLRKLIERSAPVAKSAAPAPTKQETLRPGNEQRVMNNLGKLPLVFEANHGQTDGQVKFMSRGSGYNLYLTATEAVLTLRKGKAKAQTAATRPVTRGLPDAGDPQGRMEKARSRFETTTVRMKLVGGNVETQIAGVEQQSARVNYFIGKDPAKWRTDVPTFGKVQYQDVYRGVDLAYYGKQQQLEYDFIVHPGTNPDQIRLRFDGAKKIRIDAEGDLVLTTDDGEIRQHKPIIYQEVAGNRSEVAGNYLLKNNQEIAFETGSYDPSLPLVIDPTLTYSTYLGGSNTSFPNSGGGDFGQGIAVDASGNAYVVGHSSAGDFPTTAGSFATAHNGVEDVFVAKLNPSGSALVYSTFIGGADVEHGLGIALDAAGSVYVTGLTDSLDFPTTAGALQTSLNGSRDAFVTKLNSTGSALLYSTYLGGDNLETGNSIGLDALNNAYITGVTASADFPTTPGVVDTSFNGGNDDAFVSKLNPSGSALIYSTYLGGSAVTDTATAIAVDGSGSAYVTGFTDSFDFPTTPGAFQPSHSSGSSEDAFVLKLNPLGSLIYSTFLGGLNTDNGYGIAVDGLGNAYVTGYTSSPGFPTTPGAFDTSYNFLTDVFVTKLNPAGSALVYSSFLGGADFDCAFGIAVDGSGSAYLTGITFVAAEPEDPNFPTTPDAFRTTADPIDAFFTKVNPSGSVMVYSTFLGGTDFDSGSGIAVDGSGSAYMTGFTVASNFPTTPGAFDTSYNGDGDAYVTKFGEAPPTPTPIPQIGPPANKDQCKNGGWQQFNTPRTFKNQGDCIQFVNSGQ